MGFHVYSSFSPHSSWTSESGTASPCILGRLHLRQCSERLSSDFDLPIYLTHFLTHSLPFLLHLKFVDYNLLRTPHKEGMDLSDEFLLTTGYEPNAYDFKETSVEPYTELLDSPPLFSNKVSCADPDYDDATLEDMPH